VITVLVADDHAFVREAVRDRLAQDPDLDVVAMCADGDEVLAAARRTSPDVAILDLTMARVGGLEATALLRAALPSVRVIVLTAQLDAGTVRTARDLGAAGYLLKDDDPGALPDSVRRVAAGGTAWTGAARALLDGRRSP
jgi:DNA-binding NarL/FixJ family response regulator